MTALRCTSTCSSRLKRLHACSVSSADAVIGSVCSSDLVAASVISASAQVPVISAYASSSQLSGQPFFARTVFTDSYGAAASAKLARDMGVNSVGVLIEDNAFGQGVLMVIWGACYVLPICISIHWVLVQCLHPAAYKHVMLSQTESSDAPVRSPYISWT